MQDFLELLQTLQEYFTFSPDAELRIMSMISGGCRVLSAGVSTWTINGKGDLLRFTQQITGAGLMVLGDCTMPYEKLMEDLNQTQERLLETVEREDMAQSLYLYALTPDRQDIKYTCFVKTWAMDSEEEIELNLDL